MEPAGQAETPEHHQARITRELDYIGRRSIGKYGCFACHDIPGYEDAKPIGTALNDWGRKDPARLAFEHVDEYLDAHKNYFIPGATAAPSAASEAGKPTVSDSLKPTVSDSGKSPAEVTADGPGRRPLVETSTARHECRARRRDLAKR